MRLLMTGLAMSAMLACLVACAGASGQDADRAGKAPARTLTTKERAVIDDAEGVLTKRCMAHRGYKIFLSEPPRSPADLPYGNDDVAFARKRGLGLGETLTAEERRSTPNGRYFESLSEARKDGYLEALNGGPDHEVSVRLSGGQQVTASTRGCTAAAQRKLYGDFTDWFRTSTTVGQLPSTYMADVAKDPRYRRAEKAWAACMRTKGHAVATPAELRSKAMRSPDEQRERAAAVDEARCGRKTGLPRIGRQVERKYRERTHHAHRRLVHHYQALSVAALHQARDVTAASHR